MQFKPPKNTEERSWTKHSLEKMRFYGLSPQRVLRVLKSPERCEKAIAPNCIACMQSVGQKRKTEIWVMYQNKVRNSKSKIRKNVNHKKIITVWRYPGVSPIRGKIPIPKDILEEIKLELRN